MGYVPYKIYLYALLQNLHCLIGLVYGSEKIIDLLGIIMMVAITEHGHKTSLVQHLHFSYMGYVPYKTCLHALLKDSHCRR